MFAVFAHWTRQEGVEIELTYLIEPRSMKLVSIAGDPDSQQSLWRQTPQECKKYLETLKMTYNQNRPGPMDALPGDRVGVEYGDIIAVYSRTWNGARPWRAWLRLSDHAVIHHGIPYEVSPVDLTLGGIGKA